MSPRHLVADSKLTFCRNIYFDHLYDAGRQIIAFLQTLNSGFVPVFYFLDLAVIAFIEQIDLALEFRAVGKIYPTHGG